MHGSDIVKDLIRSHSLCHPYAKSRLISQTTCAVYVKGAILSGRKAKIPVRRMRDILWRIRKSHLQLSGQFFPLDKAHKIISRF